MHAVPVLWRIHRVHHTDPVLDISTGLRHHPLEHLVGAPVALAVVALLGLPLWAALLTDAVLLAGALLKHLDGDLPAPVERWAALLLATPTVHRLHHSAAVAETDSSFGNLVIVWDRLFGTFRDPALGNSDLGGPGPRQPGTAGAGGTVRSGVARLVAAIADRPARSAAFCEIHRGCGVISQALGLFPTSICLNSVLPCVNANWHTACNHSCI